ncbi:MAG: hypothetical protein ABJF10_01850 [Chthoniobacter sp.]|uniref:hypothetical protein n=1 Tax=Chthoniobacter sp. TaxID=2510640 RepID=UPI0032ACE04B
MSENIKKGRSPSCPQMPLSEAIELAAKLHSAAHKAAIGRDNAARQLGYAGLNGAALTTLATLNQYGLIDAKRGESLNVSDLAVRLIHPMNDQQEMEARRNAALHPKVFSELLEKGFNRCEEKVIMSHLVQNGFTPLAASNVADSFKQNVEFAKLGDASMVAEEKDPKNSPPASNITPAETIEAEKRSNPPAQPIDAPAATHLPDHHKMLAQYTIPLGANQATLVFTGQELTVDDFDALADFVEFSKRQFVRAQKSPALQLLAEAGLIPKPQE